MVTDDIPEARLCGDTHRVADKLVGAGVIHDHVPIHVLQGRVVAACLGETSI